MRCPKCGLELRVKRRTEEGKLILICVNPKCEYCTPDRVVAVIEG